MIYDDRLVLGLESTFAGLELGLGHPKSSPLKSPYFKHQVHQLNTYLAIVAFL